MAANDITESPSFYDETDDEEETFEEETLEEETLKDETFKEEIPPREETFKEEIPSKEVSLKDESLKEESLKEESLKEESLKEESLKEESLKEESLKEESLKEESLKEETPPKGVCMEYYLFLLEFFVRRASGERLAKLNQMFFVPTSVRFSFLDFVDEDDLEVTPVDPLFRSQAGVANDVETFNVGKSVLFAVDRDAVTDCTVRMIVRINVRKRMPEGIKPDVPVGTGELDLSGHYAALRLETLQCWRRDVTPSNVFDGRVPLFHDGGGKATGELDVYVRMSSFGQTIVTEFDAPKRAKRDPTTFVFAGEMIDDGNAIYNLRKLDSRAALQFLKDSSEDLRKCAVCLPARYPCVPCGKLAAVEKRGDKRGAREKQDDREKKLKHTTSRGIIQTSRGPSQLCGKPVVLKVSGIFDDGDGVGVKKPTVTVAEEFDAAKPDDQSDPDHDVFVLRIGKKGLVGVGEKSDIQLEMKTPKGPERRPPIRYETREMQTEVDKKPKSPKVKKKKKTKK